MSEPGLSALLKKLPGLRKAAIIKNRPPCVIYVSDSALWVNAACATAFNEDVPWVNGNKTMRTLRLVVLSILAVAWFAFQAHADAPVVAPAAATGLSNTVASLNGTVNPGGSATTA